MAQVPPVEQYDHHYLTLTGVKSPAKLDDYFASSMVDIAAVTEVFVDSVKVVPDTGIDLSKQEDVDWLTGIIVIALSECDEAQAAIAVHVEHEAPP